MTVLVRFLSSSLLCLTPLVAQGQERASRLDVPREMLPPAGKCRIWMEGVAPAQQPAPTDCQTALRQRPSTGTVVFGPAAKEAPAQGFVRLRSVQDTSARAIRPARPVRPTKTPDRSDSSASPLPPEPQF